MSRCFPFPPPGYEKKTRTGDLDLLLKEKHKEKKCKKEKKEREKKESKDKREKDGSKEKYRDKDRKERHKDKKREKDRKKDKRRSTDDQKNEGKKADDTCGKIMEKNQVAEEKRFADEFIRRIRNDGRNAGDQMVEKFNGMDHRQIEGTEKAKDIGVKEKNKEKWIQGIDRSRVIEVKDKSKERRTEGVDRPKENLKGKDNNKEQKTEGIDRPKKDVMGNDKSKERQVHGIYRAHGDGIGKEKNKEWPVDGIDRPKEDVVGRDKSREFQVQGIGRPKEVLLGKDENKEWGVEGIGRPKDIEGKEKKKEKEGDSKKKERCKDGDQQQDEKRGKPEDKSRDKEKEKEKEKVKEKVVHKLIKQKLGERGHKLLPGTLSVATAGHAKDDAKSAGVGPHVQKRKEMEINGAFHDGLRATKLLRPASATTLPLENGRLETVQIAVHHTSDQGGSDSRKPESVIDSSSCFPFPFNQEHKINGKIETLLPAVSLKLSASPTFVATSTGTAGSTKPPHPDSKYLSQILTVPKMAEWSNFDDQEWLFSRTNSQTKPSFQSEIDGMPQVWSEALHVEAADMHALPYVIPY